MIENNIRVLVPDVPGVSEVLHATFVGHAYPLHSHQTWTVLIIDEGAVRYDIHHQHRGADRRRITVLPPYVAHDGESAQSGASFRKRVLYLEADTIGESLVGEAVDDSTIDDPRLRRDLVALHASFDRPRNDLELEERVDGIVVRIRQHLTKTGLPKRHPKSVAGEALREFLDSRPFEQHRLGDVAAHLGWNTTHLIRSFTATFGIPPHRYLISRRVEEARRLLAAGQPPAEVAIHVGFYDQAHLNRQFRVHMATTPGRYQRSAALV